MELKIQDNDSYLTRLKLEINRATEEQSKLEGSIDEGKLS